MHLFFLQSKVYTMIYGMDYFMQNGITNLVMVLTGTIEYLLFPMIALTIVTIIGNLVVLLYCVNLAEYLDRSRVYHSLNLRLTMNASMTFLSGRSGFSGAPSVMDE